MAISQVQLIRFQLQLVSEFPQRRLNSKKVHKITAKRMALVFQPEKVLLVAWEFLRMRLTPHTMQVTKQLGRRGLLSLGGAQAAAGAVAGAAHTTAPTTDHTGPTIAHTIAHTGHTIGV